MRQRGCAIGSPSSIRTPPVSEPRPEHTSFFGIPPHSYRLHPAVLGVWSLRQAWPFALVAIGGQLPLLFTLPMLAVVLLQAGLRWLRFSYRLTGDALVIEEGLLARKQRTIPFDRIQAVDISRRLTHRPFGVVELRVETVGAGSAEGKFDALASDDAQRLRNRLLRLAPDEPSASEPGVDSAERTEEHVLVRLTPGWLVRAGLTGGRIGVAAAIVGAGQQLFGDRIDELVESVPGLLGRQSGAVLAVVIVAGLSVMFLLSVAATALAYWDFTVVRDGQTLRIRTGLLNQRAATIPLRRVQSVSLEENLLRRCFGWASLSVEVAGRADDQGQFQASALLPLGPRGQAEELAALVLDAIDPRETALEVMPTRARTRRMVRAAVFSVAVTAALVYAFGPLGWLGLLTLLPAAGLAEASYRALGWAHRPGLTVSRRGGLLRRTTMVPERSLQALVRRSSFFQRRRRLATLEAHVAGGVDASAKLLDLDAQLAEQLLERLAGIAVTSASVEEVPSAPGDDGPQPTTAQAERVEGGGFEPPKA